MFVAAVAQSKKGAVRAALLRSTWSTAACATFRAAITRTIDRIRICERTRDVDPAKVLPLVEKYWGAWKRGSYKVDVPAEPPPSGPKAVHVPWTTPTLPWVTVSFRGPAFSTTQKEWAALDLLLDLAFGPTSDLYRRLVEREQKVDQLFPMIPASADPQLLTAGARVKKIDWARLKSNVADKLSSMVCRKVATP